MSAIGVHHTATDDRAWDGPANEARLRTNGDAAYYRRAFAWQDPDGDPATKAAYRFIHHFVGSDGQIGAASTRACSAGIAVLNGGRGGTTIPDADRQGVYNHLAAHLRDAEMEPPELKALGLADAGMERRSWPLAKMEVRQADDGQTMITGYAALYNVWSEPIWGFVEQIAPGFFDGVLNNDVRALWQHEPGYVLGRTTNRTLRLATDGRGLQVNIDPPDTGWARDALVSIRRGDVSQMSFGFDVEMDEWELASDGIVRRTLLTASRLYDVSPVTFAAYPQTTVEVRNRFDKLRAQLVETIDRSPAELRAQFAMMRRKLKMIEDDRGAMR